MERVIFSQIFVESNRINIRIGLGNNIKHPVKKSKFEILSDQNCSLMFWAVRNTADGFTIDPNGWSCVASLDNPLKVLTVRRHVRFDDKLMELGGKGISRWIDWERCAL